MKTLIIGLIVLAASNVFGSKETAIYSKAQMINILRGMNVTERVNQDKKTPFWQVFNEIVIGKRLRKWIEPSKRSYLEWIEVLETQLDKKSGPYFNLFFLLDYIQYQNKYEDYGVDKNSLLSLRQVYIDKYLDYLVLEKKAEQREKGFESLGDYLKKGHVASTASAVRISFQDAETQEALKEAAKEVQPRSIFELIFAGQIESALKNETKRKVILKITQKVLTYNGEGSIWDILREENMNRSEVIRLMGSFLTQRHLILANTIDWILDNNIGDEAIEVVRQSALAYFKLQEIAEIETSAFGEVSFTKVPGVESPSTKSHHFLSGAAIGCMMALEGVDLATTQSVDKYFISSYKSVILLPNLALSLIEGRSPKQAVTSNRLDQIHHVDGATFGHEACQMGSVP